MSSADDSVKITVYRDRDDMAQLNVAVNFDVKSFEISNKEIVDVTNGNIFWNYPIGEMTVRFIADAESKTPFKLHLKTASILNDEIDLFRKLDGQEIPIEKKDEEAIFVSDSNNQCVIKFVGPDSLKYYGVSIDYSIEK